MTIRLRTYILNQKYSPIRIRRYIGRQFKELVKVSTCHYENEGYGESRRSQLAVLYAGVNPQSFERKSILEVGCGHGIRQTIWGSMLQKKMGCCKDGETARGWNNTAVRGDGLNGQCGAFRHS